MTLCAKHNPLARKIRYRDPEADEPDHACPRCEDEAFGRDGRRPVAGHHDLQNLQGDDQSLSLFEQEDAELSG